MTPDQTLRDCYCPQNPSPQPRWERNPEISGQTLHDRTGVLLCGGGGVVVLVTTLGTGYITNTHTQRYFRLKESESPSQASEAAPRRPTHHLYRLPN